MSGALAVAPALVPLASAVATALTMRRPAVQRVASWSGTAALLASALALVARAAAGDPVTAALGDWPPPFAIVFHVDRTGAVLVLVGALLAAAALLFLESDADTRPIHPVLLPLVHGMLAGVGGAFATADLFNLYVWFEVMLVSAIGLLALGGRAHHLEAAFKYLVLNVLGTLLLLVAVAAVYAVTGQFGFAAIARAWPATPPAVAAAVAAALLLAFLVKAGAFPLFAWLPASYHTLPAPVLALVAGLLTKVGAYAVLRTCGGVLAPVSAVLSQALGWVAVATMLAGVLGAAYHWDLRRILAFHIVSQIGYILLGVALASEAGYAATLFYTVHHIVVKANLFLIAAIVARLAGSYDLRRVGGVLAARPALAALFAVPALSLVGVPPLSGFWAKLLVLQEALAQGRVAWTAVALAVSALTLYSMVKVWVEAFWKPHPDVGWQPPAGARLAPAWAATAVLAAVTLWIGLCPQTLAAYAQAAAAALGGR